MWPGSEKPRRQRSWERLQSQAAPSPKGMLTCLLFIFIKQTLCLPKSGSKVHAHILSATPYLPSLPEPEVSCPFCRSTNTTQHPHCARHHRTAASQTNQDPRRLKGSLELPVLAGGGHETTTFNPFGIRSRGRRAPRGLRPAQDSFPSALYLASPVFQGH